MSLQLTHQIFLARLIPFLLFLLSHLRLPSPELDPVSLRLLFCTLSPTLLVLSSLMFCRTLLINTLHEPHGKHRLLLSRMCLLVRYLAMDVLFFRAFASTGMCLPSRCQSVGIHVTIYRCGRKRSWANLRHFLRTVEENDKIARIVSFPFHIQTRHLLNTSQKCYRVMQFTQLLSGWNAACLPPSLLGRQ
jgi:hypothetical protein